MSGWTVVWRKGCLLTQKSHQQSPITRFISLFGMLSLLAPKKITPQAFTLSLNEWIIDSWFNLPTTSKSKKRLLWVIVDFSVRDWRTSQLNRNQCTGCTSIWWHFQKREEECSWNDSLDSFSSSGIWFWWKIICWFHEKVDSTEKNHLWYGGIVLKGIQKYELTVLIEKKLSTNERKLKREIEKLLSQSAQLREVRIINIK